MPRKASTPATRRASRGRSAEPSTPRGGKRRVSKSPKRSSSPAVANGSRSSSKGRSRQQRKSSARPASASAPEHKYEWGGPVGAFGITFGLPVLIYVLYWSCEPGDPALGVTGCPPSWESWPFSLPALRRWAALAVSAWSWEALGVVTAWWCGLAVLMLIVPAPEARGMPLATGERLSYPMNGFRSLLIVLAALAWAEQAGHAPLAWVARNYHSLMLAATVFSFALSFYLYARALGKSGAELASGGQSGNHLYDFFIGRELNPRVTVPLLGKQVDLKFFCELRPGLIGWLVLDLAFAKAQYEATGELSAAMLLVVAFQGLYVVDALWFEPQILTTIDIVTDGFGWMLAFGDLAWVPFVYSLQARFLVHHAPTLGPLAVAAIVAVKAVGFTLFRGANLQKDQFRQDPTHPSVQHLRTMPTARGTKLIASGIFWGVCRHMNYFGDWLNGLAWSLPTGSPLEHPVPYFYVVYFGILLVHRSLRDDEWCRLKYGADWDRYCAIVRWRIVPFVF